MQGTWGIGGILYSDEFRQTFRGMSSNILVNVAKHSGRTKDAISDNPKQEFLLHNTTMHSPTTKTLQTRKITKLGSLPLPDWFLIESA